MSYIPLFLIIPFLVMLLAIAIFPMIAPKFWDPDKNKLLVSVLLSIPVIAWFAAMGGISNITDSVVYDYIPFITLLGALFVITGGILIDISSSPKPITNVFICLIGGILASVLGTTGAAMLLIRPLIKVNEKRQYRAHTILFFIAIVANCGGLLTPLGDPPLFMMYLRGTPFTWFFNMAPEWIFTIALLLLIYYIYDKKKYAMESDEIKNSDQYSNHIQIHGKLNFLWLAGVVFAVAYFNENNSFITSIEPMPGFVREMFIILMGVLSFFLTKKSLHKENNFNWSPILEVAYLFIGIFITMVPCLIYLKNNAATIGVNQPWQFYYASGLLSGFLDNTPTAVTFYSLGRGLHMTASSIPTVAGIPYQLMKAICTGSVFFGAMTYIGNGPNFMVKSIADNCGIKMPQFFAYMYKFSLIILLPIYIIVQLLFI